MEQATILGEAKGAIFRAVTPPMAGEYRGKTRGTDSKTGRSSLPAIL